MSAAETGGPAFPFDQQTEYWKAHPGMTLRDYFAVNAMTACITALGDGSGLPLVINDERLAERSYEIADAMLKARQS